MPTKKSDYERAKELVKQYLQTDISWLEGGEEELKVLLTKHNSDYEFGRLSELYQTVYNLEQEKWGLAERLFKEKLKLHDLAKNAD